MLPVRAEPPAQSRHDLSNGLRYAGTCTIKAQRKPQSSRATAVAAMTGRFPRATRRLERR